MKLQATHGVDHYRNLILGYRPRGSTDDRETVVDVWYRLDFLAVVSEGDKSLQIHDDLGFFFQKNSGLVREARLNHEIYYLSGSVSLMETGGRLISGDAVFDLNQEDFRRYIAWSQQLLADHIAMMRSLKDHSVVLSQFSELGEGELAYLEREFLCDLEPAFSAVWRA